MIHPQWMKRFFAKAAQEVRSKLRFEVHPPTFPIMYNHALHKSTVVIFQDEEEFSVGLILNIPSNETYTLKGSDEALLRDEYTVARPVR
jgi:hypothetical protein